MTRMDDDYLERDEEEDDLPADWPEDPEERFQRFLKMYNIPDPRMKDANGNFIPIEKAGVPEEIAASVDDKKDEEDGDTASDPGRQGLRQNNRGG